MKERTRRYVEQQVHQTRLLRRDGDEVELFYASILSPSRTVLRLQEVLQQQQAVLLQALVGLEHEEQEHAQEVGSHDAHRVQQTLRLQHVLEVGLQSQHLLLLQHAHDKLLHLGERVVEGERVEHLAVHQDVEQRLQQQRGEARVARHNGALHVTLLARAHGELVVMGGAAEVLVEVGVVLEHEEHGEEHVIDHAQVVLATRDRSPKPSLRIRGGDDGHVVNQEVQ